MTLYKVLNLDGTSYHGGVGGWSLPTKHDDGSWEPGAWLEVEGPLVPCENGLHLCDGERQLLEWLGPAIFEAEYDWARLDGEGKIVVRKARLLRRFETWNGRSARLFACDCAERVLCIYEREIPGDTRPRQAIETARRFANGEATRTELDAAELAASWAASKAAWAAWDAAKAARAAAWDAGDAACAAWAAWDAARAARAARAAACAAWDAACAAERDRQTERLRQYLNAEVTG